MGGKQKRGVKGSDLLFLQVMFCFFSGYSPFSLFCFCCPFLAFPPSTFHFFYPSSFSLFLSLPQLFIHRAPLRHSRSGLVSVMLSSLIYIYITFQACSRSSQPQQSLTRSQTQARQNGHVLCFIFGNRSCWWMRKVEWNKIRNATLKTVFLIKSKWKGNFPKPIPFIFLSGPHVCLYVRVSILKT